LKPIVKFVRRFSSVEEQHSVRRENVVILSKEKLAD
jgi:hypothetical protein